MFNKMIRQRNLNKEIPVNRVQDLTGSVFTFNDIADGQIVVRSGTGFIGLGKNSATIASGAYGQMYVTSGSSGTSGGATVWTKLSGTTTLNALSNEFSMSANNRLVYQGDRASNFMVNYNVSFETTQDDQINDFALAVTGTIVSASMVQQLCDSGSTKTVESVAASAILNLTASEYVEIWHKADVLLGVTASFLNVSLNRL